LATLGLGLPALEAYVTNGGNKTYPTVLDQMVDQGLIKTRAYSLWLDHKDATMGNILFGGVDTALYMEPMWSLDMQSPDRGFIVALTGLSQGSNASHMYSFGFEEPLPALISTTNAVTLLPRALFDPIANYFGATQLFGGTYKVFCDSNVAGEFL
jgi:hypothetical protein